MYWHSVTPHPKWIMLNKQQLFNHILQSKCEKILTQYQCFAEFKDANKKFAIFLQFRRFLWLSDLSFSSKLSYQHVIYWEILDTFIFKTLKKKWNRLKTVFLNIRHRYFYDIKKYIKVEYLYLISVCYQYKFGLKT